MAYLDGNGLLYFWQKIKNTFTVKADAIKNITRSGTTFTATRADGTTFTFTQQDNNTTYTAASSTPLMDGTGAVGTSAKYAREDHVHPSDTAKVDKVEGKGLSTNDYTTAEKNKLAGIAAGATANTGTVTSVATGVGLTGGTITGSGTIKAKLKSETAATNDSATPTNTASRQYAVTPDKSGYLSVNVPWENTHQTYTAFTGKPTGNQTPGFGSTFTIQQISQSASGQVSGTDRTVKIPNTEATGSAAGLMSAADKTKLTGIDAGAQVNVYPYGECSSSATTSAKAVTVDSNFTLVAGAVVYVRFTVSNSASVTSLSLNVNGTGAKPMHWYGGQLPNKDVIWQNKLYCFVYDGENWNIVGDIDYHETITLAMANAGISVGDYYISPSVLKQFVTGQIEAAQVGAALFQGTVTAGTDISDLTAYKKGWYWVVATAGTYAGQSCEAGDMIFCVSDYSSSYKVSDFSVVQNNIVTITNAEIDTIVAS